MRRSTILTVIMPLVLVVGALLVNASVHIGAQQATPTEGTPATGAPTGVTVEVLGRGASAVVPDRELLLRRRTFAPGASTVPNPADGPVVLAVESGTVGFTVVEGAAQLTRTAATGTPGPTEAVVAGTEAILTPGDALFYDEGVVHVVRNTGDGVAVTVEARLPRVEGVPPEATPGASPLAGTPAAGDANSETVAVNIKDFLYNPDPVEIPVGGTVIWTNQDPVPHTATARDREILQSGTLKPGESFTETFEAAGTYDYFCEFHPNMKGTLVVE
ncbi:MAG: cupredoxin domain-containing protein [Chloroflexota bacterium]|nr:cupredoxin domain-containing protein [Chloroflexota bacterium]